MTRYYKLYVDCGFVGAQHEEITEVPDGEDMPSDFDLDELARDYLFESVEYGYYECDENGKRIGAKKLTTAGEQEDYGRAEAMDLVQGQHAL